LRLRRQIAEDLRQIRRPASAAPFADGEIDRVVDVGGDLSERASELRRSERLLLPLREPAHFRLERI
jgi:hypothetical protein